MMTTWHKAHKDGLTLGERAADKLRNGMGSWAFVFSFLGFMAIWATLHGLGIWNFDPFPFILLNLFLSMLAGLQGAILLIAAKRMDAISGAMAQHDLETNEAAKEEIDLLTQINQEQLIILRELSALAETKRQAGQNTDTSAAPAIQS